MSVTSRELSEWIAYFILDQQEQQASDGAGSPPTPDGQSAQLQMWASATNKYESNLARRRERQEARQSSEPDPDAKG